MPGAVERYVGLMSGTSLDGVDGVMVAFESGRPQVEAHAFQSFPAELRAELLALNSSGNDELHRAALAANGLVRIYAGVVGMLLAQTGQRASAVAAIGSHGQTVRHRPQCFDGTGYTLQLNNPALLAELTGIDVVADFRSRDVAAGGQGAPLVPMFHREVFAQAGTTVCVLNIGGISNLSVLGSDGGVIGFDCGPGNARRSNRGPRAPRRPRETLAVLDLLQQDAGGACWRGRANIDIGADARFQHRAGFEDGEEVGGPDGALEIRAAIRRTRQAGLSSERGGRVSWRRCGFRCLGACEWRGEKEERDWEEEAIHGLVPCSCYASFIGGAA